jgi:AcrR family transcriptional regulator
MIATRLRRGEVAIKGLADELCGWVQAYERPAIERRWVPMASAQAPAPSPHVPDVPIQQMPSVLPPGRPWIAPAEIAENHRLRILYAAAKLAESKGAAATTVADITKLARVDGRAFYRLFADKQEAFAAVHELGFQQVMDVTAKAFFAAEGWPQRSWEAGRALTQLLQANPMVAHVGFVEAYAVGPGAVQRIEDSHTAFLFFLQEGLVHSRDAPPSHVTMEAIIAAIFEILYLAARAPGEPQVAGMLPYIAHVWLTPFLGCEKSDAFIDSQTPKKVRSPKTRARRAKATPRE